MTKILLLKVMNANRHFSLPSVASLAGAAAVFCVLGCSKTVIYDKAIPTLRATQAPASLPSRGIGDGNNRVSPETLPTPAPSPSAPVAPPAPAAVSVKPISLKVIQVNPEAWWKTCLSVSFADDPATVAPKEIGCNKNSQIGTEVVLQAKASVCNSLRLTFKVYKNKDACVAGQPCNSTYGDTPDWIRTTSEAATLPFFKIREAANMLPLEGSIKLRSDAQTTEFTETQKVAAESQKTAGRTWVRVLFEDQSDANYALWQEKPEDWQNQGIDFNDYIFDVKSENVKLKIEGSNLQCAP